RGSHAAAQKAREPQRRKLAFVSSSSPSALAHARRESRPARLTVGEAALNSGAAPRILRRSHARHLRITRGPRLPCYPTETAVRALQMSVNFMVYAMMH